jgi:hypothetical protein
MTCYLPSTLALLGLALLLGATAYETIVMAPNYERDIPASIDLARQFLRRVTPAHYFRVISPLTQLLLVGSVVLCWGVSDARWWLLTALGALAATDVVTFRFHYPRLSIMFREPISSDPLRLRRAAREWAAGNLVRGALLVVAILSVLLAVTRLAVRSAV